ncbi:CRISPR-associated nuclease/helicase Cas3 [uncultured archaeon]|nr:CRISPR-associated nuclease/helicase Cas3 [uncultured archaeon]
MNTIFWAKPDQTYEAHINLAYEAWKETVLAKKNLIQRVGKELGFSEGRFLKSSLLTVVLHDIGKNIEPFQKMMNAKRKGERFDKRENYRHELVSFSFAIQGSVGLRNQDGVLTLLPLEALAILGHHKKINTDLQSFSRECTSIKPNFYEDGMNKALQLAEEIFTKEGFSFPKIPIHKYDSYADASKLIGYDGAFSKIFEKEKNPDSIRIIYLLLKAILHYADWYGSAEMDVNYSLKTHADDLFKDIEKRCVEKKIKYNGLRPFQEECACTLGNVIAVAPTGSGKTEASLLWALNNLQNMDGGKLIYLLPTMVTANSIFTRLEDYFGKGNVGLTHSTASFMFQDEEDNPENVRNILFDKSFIKPATVATIDQLLTSGFNTGKWTLIEANAANSVIVIDEIHSYDSWTLGLIIESIKHFSKLGTRFMLMSATLPEYFINLFSKALTNVSMIRDETLLNSCRNHYQIFDKIIDDAIPDIEKSVNKGIKTLVVVNNVAKCQELYNKLEHLHPMCYHSKFILKDRKEKEKDIDNQKLLIATQVVEVSLDIDFDVMFCECAPPDAIVQRAGRVNRRREKSDSWISIFKASDISKKIYDPEDSGLLTRSFEIFKNSPEKLTENDLIKIVEDVYSGIDIENSPNFIDASKQYSKTQERLMGIFDNPNREDKNEVTRKVDYLQIPVIPSIFIAEALSLPPSQRRLYEVKMPYWYVLKHKEQNEDITFCEMKYDSVIGAQFADDTQVSSLII